MSDDAHTLCAMVQADSEKEAKAEIVKDWPEASEWRFCEERAADYTMGDRFPVDEEWMKKRFAAA